MTDTGKSGSNVRKTVCAGGRRFRSQLYSIVLSFVDPVGDAIMWILLPCRFQCRVSSRVLKVSPL